MLLLPLTLLLRVYCCIAAAASVAFDVDVAIVGLGVFLLWLSPWLSSLVVALAVVVAVVLAYCCHHRRRQK